MNHLCNGSIWYTTIQFLTQTVHLWYLCDRRLHNEAVRRVYVDVCAQAAATRKHDALVVFVNVNFFLVALWKGGE